MHAQSPAMLITFVQFLSFTCTTTLLLLLLLGQTDTSSIPAS